MTTEAFLKTTCPKCSGAIEFPREGLGDKAPCPHCGAEVLLTNSTRARTPILIDPKSTPIPVEPPSIVLILQVIVVVTIIAAVLVVFNAGLAAGFAVGASAMVLLAFAHLIESSHATAQRIARLEVFFQSAVNERR